MRALFILPDMGEDISAVLLWLYQSHRLSILVVDFYGAQGSDGCSAVNIETITGLYSHGA